MNNHFNTQFNQDNRGQGNRQQFIQEMRNTNPHNFIQKTDNDMYGQNNATYNGGQYGYQQQQNLNQPTYHKPFVNYGVSADQRPAVVSSGGGCCCSVM